MKKKRARTQPSPTKLTHSAPDRKLVGEFIAACIGAPEKAREMLKSRPELLDGRYILNETPLHFMAVENHLEGVRFAASLGMDVNAVNEFGDTALVDAALLGNVQMVDELLRLGAEVNVTTRLRGNPLHAAMENDHWEVAERLIRAGAQTNYKTPYGETFHDVLPYDEAIRQRILALVEASLAL